MRKSVALILVLLVLATTVGGLWLYFSIDGIVRRAIVSQVAAATGVDVRLASVHLSAKEQAGDLNKFRLGNPSGYSNREPLFAFERANVALDVATIRQPVVRIRKVALEGVTIYYSGGTSGNNLQALAAQIAERGKREKSTADEDPRRLIIDSLVIADARVRLEPLVPAGRGRPFTIVIWRGVPVR